MRRNAQLAHEFSGFLHQAEANYRAGESIAGASSALLYYYAFLNLAKAELLTSTPAAVIGRELKHGLAFRPTKANTLPGDTLTVQNDGVFGLLYSKRVGYAFPRVRFHVLRAFGHVPEVGWELHEVGYPETAVRPIHHSMLWDGGKSWSLVAMPGYTSLATPAKRFIETNFTRVSVPNNWRLLLNYNGRLAPEFGWFESKHTIPHTSGAGPDNANRDSLCASTWNALQPYLELPSIVGTDGTFVHSMYKSESVPLPSSLARYAAMYYVSSLVRYKPSALNAKAHAKQAWFLDAFPSQAALPLLHSFLVALSPRPQLFGAY